MLERVGCGAAAIVLPPKVSVGYGQAAGEVVLRGYIIDRSARKSYQCRAAKTPADGVPASCRPRGK